MSHLTCILVSHAETRVRLALEGLTLMLILMNHLILILMSHLTCILVSHAETRVRLALEGLTLMLILMSHLMLILMSHLTCTLVSHSETERNFQETQVWGLTSYRVAKTHRMP